MEFDIKRRERKTNVNGNEQEKQRGAEENT